MGCSVTQTTTSRCRFPWRGCRCLALHFRRCRGCPASQLSPIRTEKPETGDIERRRRKSLMDHKDHSQEIQKPAGEEEQGIYREGQGVAQAEVRDHNRRLILEYLREQGPTLRAELALNLGLSRATVTNI